MNNRLSIIIPTAGRPSLARTLESYAHQMRDGDELIVVGDVHDGPLPGAQEIADQYDAWYISLDAGHHCWGHCQANLGIDFARGDYVLGNDDDDVATPDALAAIRQAISELDRPRPLLFRWMSWMDVVYWDRRSITENRIGGHSLVTPNLPGRVGRYTCRYNGDFDFIRSTVDLWPNKDADVVWRENLIAWARPTEDEWRTILRPKVEAAVCR